MAIAFDAQANSAYSPATSVTWSHTISGSNKLIVAGAYLGTSASASATYNGVAMTQIGTGLAMVGGASGQYLRMFYLINPAAGANNCVISSAADIYGMSVSYTGAKQSGQPDSTNQSASASTTSHTVNTTTVDDNSWLVAVCYGQTATVGAGTTARSAAVAGVIFMADSNGAKSPAGSYGLNFTQSANFAGMIVASISPAGAVIVGSDPMFMGAAF